MSAAAEALHNLSTAFAARDVEAALDCFVSHDDLIYSGSEVGEVAAGREELGVLLAGLFGRDVAYSWHVTKIWSRSRGALELVTAEAIGHARGGGEDADFAYRLTGALSLEGEGWRWLQLHGSEPAGVP